MSGRGMFKQTLIHAYIVIKSTAQIYSASVIYFNHVQSIVFKPSLGCTIHTATVPRNVSIWAVVRIMTVYTGD